MASVAQAVASATTASVGPTEDEDVPMPPADSGQQDAFHTSPLPPPAPQRSVYNDWEALDHVPIMSCFTSPFAHLDKVPLEHAEGWAHVWVDVMDHFETTQDDAGRRGPKQAK